MPLLFLLKDFKRALQLLVQASPLYAVRVGVLQLLLALIPSALILSVKYIIDIITNPQTYSQSSLVWMVAIYIAIQLFSALLTQWSTQLIQIYQERVTNFVSIEVLRKATEVEYAYYEQTQYHDTLHIAQQQAMHKSAALLVNITALIQQFLTLLTLSIFLFSLSWVCALFLLCIPIPLSIVKAYFTRESFIKEKDLAENERKSFYYQHLATSPLYAKEIRTFSLGQYLILRYNKIREYIFNEKRKLLSLQSKYVVLIEFVEIIAIGLLFFYLARNAWQQTISAGLFILYLQTFQRVQLSAKSWMQALVGLYQQRLFLSHLFQFLQMPLLAKRGKEIFPLPLYKLIIQDLHFAYPDTDNEILKGITFEAHRGEFIAIVGENGSGKSTLIKLLANLYPQYTGNILMNGVPLSVMDPVSFRDNAAILFQDFEKYYFTISDNISMGRFDEEAEAEKKLGLAAKLAGADYINDLPNKFSAQLGRSFAMGTQLSGGQWQKLALARIFYKNAPLIILDEPGSALDANAEFSLFDRLCEQQKDKITIVVSHRLYAIQRATRIYVLDKGSIVEQGNFAALVEKKGFFYRMLEAQQYNTH